MLANIIDVDFEAMRVSLRQPHGAVLLFDFEAAFPSVSHEYLWSVLSHLGLPAGILRAIQSLYDNNSHLIRIKGFCFPSLTCQSGVRQGCPLSPILFAVVADLLLRRLAEEFPSATVRAFADDTAMITENFHRDGPRILAKKAGASK